jgi:DUF971 family protein
MRPTKIEVVPGDRLAIEWDDGQRREYGFKELRDACPCATCREKRSERKEPASPMMLPILSPEEARPLKVTGMRPIGQYAYAIAFSDGHDTGIYTFEFLRELGRAV